MSSIVPTQVIPTADEIVGPTPAQQMRRRIFGHRGLMIGSFILLAIIAMAATAPILAPHDPYDQDLLARLAKYPLPQ